LKDKNWITLFKYKLLYKNRKIGSKLSFLKKPELVEVAIPQYIIDITPRILYFATRYKYPLTYTIKDHDREIAYSVIKSINKENKDYLKFYLQYNIYKKLEYLINILKKTKENSLKYSFQDRIMISEILTLVGNIQKEKYPNMKMTNIKLKIYPI
jgi:hypothetical protein